MSKLRIFGGWISTSLDCVVLMSVIEGLNVIPCFTVLGVIERRVWSEFICAVWNRKG